MSKILFITSIVFTIIFTACENEPVDMPEINTDIIDEELFRYLNLISDEPVEEDYNCIEFNYDFTVYVFNENLELDDVVTVYDNSSFISLLGNLDETQSISVSYPISGTLNNGEAVNINTNEELSEALKDCSLINIQVQCNNILEDEECDWSIIALEDFPNQFENDTLKLTDDGTLTLYHDNYIYYGIWITLYIGDILYLNIDLNDDAIVEEFWDHNWQVLSFTEEAISISNNSIKVGIEKYCTEICDSDSFIICEAKENTGFGSFDFTKYIPCISINASQNPIAAIKVTFYESEINANTAVDPIIFEDYTNQENPQTIFVRIAYKNDGTLLEIKTITINAVPCDAG